MKHHAFFCWRCFFRLHHKSNCLFPVSVSSRGSSWEIFGAPSGGPQGSGPLGRIKRGPREARRGPKWAGSGSRRSPRGTQGGEQSGAKNKNPLSRPGPMTQRIFTNESFALWACGFASCCAGCLCDSVRLPASPLPIIAFPQSRTFVGFVRHWNLRCDGHDNRFVVSRCRLCSWDANPLLHRRSIQNASIGDCHFLNDVGHREGFGLGEQAWPD